MKRAFKASLIASLLSFDLAASQPMPPMPDPTFGEIPPKSAEPWIALAVLGRRNQPIPVTYFFAQKIEAMPRERFTHWVKIERDVFQSLLEFTRTQSCGWEGDRPKGPRSASGGNWLDISERQHSHWVHLCILPPPQATAYLSALMTNPKFERSAERSEGVALVLRAYREGYLN